jgi:hypothetical protein
MNKLLMGLAVFFLAVSSAWAHSREGGVRSGAYTLELIDESGRALRTYQHQGRTYVLGAKGQRYLLRIHNHSAGRIEIVASVDGRDVVDGRTARTDKRGYIVDPYSEMVIDGFRTSEQTVAAFRFSNVSASYASQMGDARDVGVIGVAVFSERYVPPPPPPEPYYHRDDRISQRGAPASEAPSASADASGASREETASRAPSMQKKSERPGLGTQFGEEHSSHVSRVEFVRASTQPGTVMSLRYNDRRGLIALGIDVDGARTARNELWLREQAQPFRGNGYAQPPPNWMR